MDSVGTDKEQIYGIYEKQIYFNPETGQTAFLLRPKDETTKNTDDKGCVKVTGKFCLQRKSLPLKVTGEWKQSEYGIEFLIDEVELCSETTEDTERFCMELDTPVPRRQIRKITSVTGPDIFKAAETTGIEETICEKTKTDEFTVVDLFAEMRRMKNELTLFQILVKYSGTYEQCMKIMKEFPDNALDVLENDPFQIVDRTSVPFKLIDQIALDNGVDSACESRVQAILLWCIRRETNSGNVYINFKSLCKAASKAFGNIPDTAIASALRNHPRIVQDKKHKDIYYEKQILADENTAARNFSRLMKTKKNLPWHPEYITRIEKEEGWKFGSQQKEAFYLLQSTGIKVLTGDPGTGKTTTLKGLLKYLVILWNELYERNPQVALCAPSGRAAQRMKEATKRYAQTIHKLIEYQPYKDGEYFRDANNPIDADIVIVNETSMMGLSLFAKLVSAVRSGALMLFVGDINQLPSVECGDVLHDIIYLFISDFYLRTKSVKMEKEGVLQFLLEGASALVDCYTKNGITQYAFNKKNFPYIITWDRFYDIFLKWDANKTYALSDGDIRHQKSPEPCDTKKYELEIASLKKEIQVLKNKESNEKSLAMENACLQKQVKELAQECREKDKDKKELVSLRNFIYKTQSQEKQGGPKQPASMEDVAKALGQVSGILAGGHIGFQNKIRQYLPGWKLIPAGQKTPESLAYNADIVVFYTDHLDHATYKPLIRSVRDSKCKLLYIENINIETVLNTIYSFCKKERVIK